MNILMITEDHSKSNFGITAVVSQLCDHLISQYSDLKIHIFTTSPENVTQNEKAIIVSVQPSVLGNSWKWSPELASSLEEVIKNFQINIIHLHGIWMAAQHTGLMLAKKYSIPVLISTHGMFQPWLWKEQGKVKQIKKNLYYSLLLRPTISSNVIFHALSQDEAETLTDYFPKQKKVIIPNAINLENAQNFSSLPKKNRFLFLGRIHPIKAVDLLVQAFFLANLGKEWSLCIVGPDNAPDYTANVRNKINELSLSNQISLTGPVFGDNKQSYYEHSWALVLPSYSEGFPMVSLEAARCGLPTLLTIEAGLENWSESGGLTIKPEINDITSKLVEAASWSLSERISRGEQTFQYVKQNYSWDVVIPKWHDLYQQMSVS